MPMKSLAHFECVNKLWNELINDSYLANIHTKRAAEDFMLICLVMKFNEQRKLVCFNVAKEEFRLIDHPKYQAERDGTFKDLVQLDGEVGLAYNNVGQSVKIEQT
ncbi:F-box domain containing protein [Tanacetum coccineum]